MKNYLILASLAAAVVACTPSKDKEAQHALTAYAHFVDSVSLLNDNWKAGIDTDFVEVPIDPTDPSKIRLDTIVTLPDDKEQSILFHGYFGREIQKGYEPLKAAADAQLPKMDEEMKKAYQQSIDKFESMPHP